jgi:hypothetical protein
MYSHLESGNEEALVLTVNTFDGGDMMAAVIVVEDKFSLLLCEI